MDPLRIAIRCIVTFSYLLLMLRINGKTVISQSTAFDFVLSLILGDLIDDFLFAEVSASRFVVASFALVLADLTVKFIGHRNDSFNFLVNGHPSVIVRNGKSEKSAMKSEYLSESDLLAFLRLRGYDEQTRNEIESAILEDSGHVSVIEKQEYKPVQKKDKRKLKIQK
jgi:uncharacterized membrane protein YcaP (DUF421 family)